MTQRFSDLKKFCDSADADTSFLAEHEVTVIGQGGVSHRITKIGNGEPVIFIPMLHELNFLYTPVMKSLSERYSAYTYSPALKSVGMTTPEHRANDLASILEAVSSHPVHLVAWSDSSAVICSLLESRPAIVKSAAFIAVPDRYIFKFPINLGLDLLYRFPFERLPIRRVLLRCLGSLMGGVAIPPRFVEARAATIPDLVRIFKDACLPCIKKHSPLKHKAPCSTLVIGGDSDKVSSIEQSRRFAEAMGAHLVVLRGGDHFPTYTQPDQVSAALMDFITPK
ncbi:alpha/beta fold hydrolase [Brevifollis gellanilyticus]|uniref:alpha/beta fold hydrolase n=1 Tax=Brevifollis gellanilyticus TaxID=748831 RepID=UPI0011BEA59E|nr:alpha/beta hydrolase [Brevifollis gellanilyticus]